MAPSTARQIKAAVQGRKGWLPQQPIISEKQQSSKGWLPQQPGRYSSSRAEKGGSLNSRADKAVTGAVQGRKGWLPQQPGRYSSRRVDPSTAGQKRQQQQGRKGWIPQQPSGQSSSSRAEKGGSLNCRADKAAVAER